MQTTSKKSTYFFIRACWALCKPYWNSEEKWSAYALFGLTVVLSVITVRLGLALNDFSKDFYNAISSYNKAGLITALTHFVVIVSLLIISTGGSYYFNTLLNTRWRRWLTGNYLSKWLNSHAHYRMQLSQQRVDNPDQRISEDLEALPELSLNIFFIFFQSILTLAMFGTLLWQLTKTFPLPIESAHISFYGYIFWSAIAYGLLGTWIIRWIGKKLSHFDYQQQLFSANFRYSLIRLRETSEQVAFYNGEAAEKKRFMHQFSYIFSNTLNILSLRMRLAFFSTGFNNVALILGIILAIPLYLQKKMPLGGMMQISGAFGHVVNAFTSLVNSYALFAAWRAVILRLTELNQSIDQATHLTTQIEITQQEQDHLVATQLTINLPSGEPLIEKLQLSFQSGERILITGTSGSGKSTLLRAIAGLWPYGSGQIHLPKDHTLLFLPQKPYLPIGSIKEILLFPTNTVKTDDELVAILEYCGLQKLQSQLHEQKHWAQVLSLGEQQLLAFAQALLQQPNIIFLDEATSALDEKMEAVIYTRLRESLPKTTIISVGHRYSLHPLHEKILVLSQEGLAPKMELAGVA